ncbi:MAG: transporter [Planctomycetes bacterium]|nr:transporter [Planctomycetota bacterium]
MSKPAQSLRSLVRPSAAALLAGTALLLAPPVRAVTDPGAGSVDPFRASAGEVVLFERDGDGGVAEAGAHHDRPDGHAPLGVMGDHLHAPGSFMLSVRAMSMHMSGLRDGTHRESSADTFARGFAVAPETMTMEMLMLGAMAGVSDDVTLVAMLPYLRNEMSHVTAGGAQFTTKSEGLGDARVGGIVRLAGAKGDGLLLGNLALSLPTGTTNAKDSTPASGGVDVRLPYPMQLGSGTYDVIPGLTYTTATPDGWSFGAQGNVRIPLETNDRGYRLGRRTELTTWVARELSDSTSVSTRLGYTRKANIHGADPLLNPNMVPTADPNRQGGERLDLLVGLNWLGQDGALKGHRFAIEFGVPVWQDLSGPQLEVDRTLVFGWQKAF